MSAFGTKRTSGRAQSMSAFGGKADIDQIPRNSESAATDNRATIVSDNGRQDMAYLQRSTLDRRATSLGSGGRSDRESIERSHGRSRQAGDDIGLNSEQKVAEHLFQMPFLVAADATNLQSEESNGSSCAKMK